MTQRLKLNDRVSINHRPTTNPNDKRTKITLQGVVAYLGPVSFADGDDWVGIRFIGNSVGQGRNDGSVDGKLYFKERCRPKDGIFVRRDAVTRRVGSFRSLIALHAKEEDAIRDEKEEDLRLEVANRDGHNEEERKDLLTWQNLSAQRFLGSRMKALEREMKSLKSERMKSDLKLEEITLDNQRMKEQLEVVTMDNKSVRKRLHDLMPIEMNERNEVAKTIMEFSSCRWMDKAGSGNIIRAQRQIEASTKIRIQKGDELCQPITTQLDELYADDRRVDGFFSIPVQNRGTTICQLRVIHSNLERRCETEGWTNFQGKQIIAKDVCLYDVNEKISKPFTDYSRKSLIDGATYMIRQIIFRQSLTLGPTSFVMLKYDVTYVGHERVLQQEYQVVAMDHEPVKRKWSPVPTIPIEEKHRDEQ